MANNNINLFVYVCLFTHGAVYDILSAKEKAMAYVAKMNTLKNGDATYYINQVSRVPGEKNRQKAHVVEKYTRSALLADGKDPETFVAARLAELRGESGAVVRSLDYKVDLKTPLTLSARDERGADDLCRNLGHIAYSRLYHRLELDELLNNRRRYTKAEYNINVLFQHLVYSRLLEPESKLGTWGHRTRFFGGTSYGVHAVYRCMDHVLEWRDDILRQLDKQMTAKFGRKEAVIYYDVTNYYFERDDEDDKDGLRARGCSKEHRPEPIIQMGLFMDELGLPISYELFRGNTNDSVTFPKAMDKSVVDFSSARRIIVADKGMLSYHNVLKIRNDRNGYVISQSIRKSDEETKAFALDDAGWKDVVDDKTGEPEFRIKERDVIRTASSYGEMDERKHSGPYGERQVFVWSRKYEERARKQREETIRKALEYEGTKSSDAKDSSFGKLKYVRKKPVSKDGQTLGAANYVVEFDTERLAKDEMLDGYYIICTNVEGIHEDKGERADPNYGPDHCRFTAGYLKFNRAVPAREIVDIYGGLWKIEETFKVTKTGMLNLRPVFHSSMDRIRAHFLICFVSLVLERLLEFSIGWEFSSRSIQESLSRFNATLLPESNIYMVTYYDAVIDRILKAMDIGISKRFMVQSEIRNVIKESKKKDYEQGFGQTVS